MASRFRLLVHWYSVADDFESPASRRRHRYFRLGKACRISDAKLLLSVVFQTTQFRCCLHGFRLCWYSTAPRAVLAVSSRALRMSTVWARPAPAANDVVPDLGRHHLLAAYASFFSRRMTDQAPHPGRSGDWSERALWRRRCHCHSAFPVTAKAAGACRLLPTRAIGGATATRSFPPFCIVSCSRASHRSPPPDGGDAGGARPRTDRSSARRSRARSGQGRPQYKRRPVCRALRRR